MAISPKDLEAIVQAMGGQKSAQLEQLLKPRGKIAQSERNRPQVTGGLAGWYENNPSYRPGESDSDRAFRVGRENQVPAGRSAAPSAPLAAAPPQGQGESGGGLWGFMRDLLNATPPEQTQQSGPKNNSLTGMPIGTLPGDPAYNPNWEQNQQQPAVANGAPQRNSQPQPAVTSPPPAAPLQPAQSPAPAPVPQTQAQPQGQPAQPWLPQGQPQQLAQPVAAQPAPAPPPITSLVDEWQQPAQELNPGKVALNSAGLPALMAQGVTAAANPFARVANHAATALAQSQAATSAAIGSGTSATNIAPALKSAMAMEAQLASNAAAARKVAAPAMKVAGALGTGSKFGALAGTAAKVAAPLQAGMMGLEAGRLALDPEFAAQAKANYGSLEGQSGLARMLQGVGAPISTITNSVGGLQDMVASNTNASFSEAALEKAKGRNTDVKKQQAYLRSLGLSSAEIQKAMAQFRTNKKKSTRN